MTYLTSCSDPASAESAWHITLAGSEGSQVPLSMVWPFAIMYRWMPRCCAMGISARRDTSES